MKHLHHGFGHAEGDTTSDGDSRLIHWARRYDLFVAVFSLGQMRAVRRKTVELAGIQPGDRVLDVGCGTGDLTLVAAGRAGAQGEVAGIDASPEMIEVAREKAAGRNIAVRFEVAPIQRLPFSDNYFDAALSSLMLHHLPGDVKLQGLAEVYRVLRPGGRLLVVDLRNRPTGIARAVLALSGHGHGDHKGSDLVSLLAQAGFADVTAGSFALGIMDYALGVKRAQ